ncbi:hypothetical protein BDP67DRAFT_488266 [Colletotrichum lupini]|nr:hypothetical protein BDP67DRAFT_488266 [Colletotrichum lupini]
MAGEHLGLGGGRSLSFCLVGAAAAHHTMGQGRWAKTAKGLASMKRAPAMAAFDIAQIPHLHNHRSEGGDDYAMKCLRLSRGSEPKHLRWRPPKTRAQGRDENVPKTLRSGTVYTWYQPFPIDDSFIRLSQRGKMLPNTTFRVNEAMPRLVGCFGTRSEAHVKALDLFAKYTVWSSGMRPRPPSGKIPDCGWASLGVVGQRLGLHLTSTLAHSPAGRLKYGVSKWVTGFSRKW